MQTGNFFNLKKKKNQKSNKIVITMFGLSIHEKCLTGRQTVIVLVQWFVTHRFEKILLNFSSTACPNQKKQAKKMLCSHMNLVLKKDIMEMLQP